MNKFRALLAALLITPAVPGIAQQDIAGTWSGMLPAGPGTTVEIHFVVTSDGEGYSTVLTSPNPGGIQDLPATSTSFEDGVLVLTVDDLAGRYEGAFENGAFSGNWYQQGQAIPLDLVPYVEAELAGAAMDQLRGSWVGELTVQGITLAIVYRFEQDEEGRFVGFLDSPDQGALGIPVTSIRLDDGALSFAIPQISGEYTATLDGDSMTGTFTQLGMPTPLDMSRGEYVQRGLELSQEVMDRLEGSWVGSIQGPGGALTIVFRFEPTADGGMAALLDSPDQGASGIPINEVNLEGDSLELVIAAAQASFTAMLSAGEMAGTWAQGNMSQPVTLVREP